MSTQDAKEPSSTMLYVSNLPFSFEDNDLKKLFAGFEIQSAYVATRRNGRSKGFGFVTFATSGDQQKALKATEGKELDGRAITIKVAHKDERRDSRGELKEEFKTETSEPRKRRERGGGDRTSSNNNADNKPKRAPAADRQPSETMLYVSNIPFDFGDDELKKLFQSYSPKSARVARRHNDKSKGFGFVEFDDQKSQQAALSALDNHTIGDRQISVKISIAGARGGEGNDNNNSNNNGNNRNNNRNNNNNNDRNNKSNNNSNNDRNNNNDRKPRGEKKQQQPKDDSSKPAELSETTVYVSNLPFDLTDQSLAELFGKLAKPASARIARKRDERSKGFGFVVFESHKDQLAALTLDNMQLGDRALSVKVAKKGSETRQEDGGNNKTEGGDEKRKRTRGPKTTGGSDSGAPKADKQPSDTLVYVSNLNFDLDDAALAKLFDGLSIKSAHVAVRRNGRSKGFGFVEFNSAADQKKALSKSGIDVGGRTLTVEAAMEKKE